MSLREPIVVIIKVLPYGPKDVNNVFWAVFFFVVVVVTWWPGVSVGVGVGNR